MELPYVFRTTLDSIPATVPYFEVGEGAAVADDHLAVGIAWRGGSWDRRRDVPFSLITKLADVPGVRFMFCRSILIAMSTTRNSSV